MPEGRLFTDKNDNIRQYLEYTFIEDFLKERNLSWKIVKDILDDLFSEGVANGFNPINSGNGNLEISGGSIYQILLNPYTQKYYKERSRMELPYNIDFSSKPDGKYYIYLELIPNLIEELVEQDISLPLDDQFHRYIDSYNTIISYSVNPNEVNKIKICSIELLSGLITNIDLSFRDIAGISHTSGVGFNADKVDGKDVDDNGTSDLVLWTANKILSEIKLHASMSTNGGITSYQSETPNNPDLFDRYIVKPIGVDEWTGKDNHIAIWSGEVWIFIFPEEGFRFYDNSSNNILYWTGTDWAKIEITLDLSDMVGNLDDISDGTSYKRLISNIADLLNQQISTNKIFKKDNSGNTILDFISNDNIYDDQIQKEKLNNNVAGQGLSRNNTTKALDINVDNSTIEISSDSLQIKNLGVTALKLADDSVTRDKINPNIAGNGLIQLGDGSLAVSVDNSTIEISKDILRIKNDGITRDKINPNIAGNGIGVESNGALKINIDSSSLEIVNDTLRVKSSFSQEFYVFLAHNQNGSFQIIENTNNFVHHTSIEGYGSDLCLHINPSILALKSALILEYDIGTTSISPSWKIARWGLGSDSSGNRDSINPRISYIESGERIGNQYDEIYIRGNREGEYGFKVSETNGSYYNWVKLVFKK